MEQPGEHPSCCAFHEGVSIMSRSQSEGGPGRKMSVKIITDSTSDIPPEVASELGIHVVPLYVHFGDQVYRDGVDLTGAEFYRRLTANKTLPTTSTISPGEFAQIYDTLAEETDEILAIMLSSELSATFEAASKGKEYMKAGRCRVEVIDSRLVVMGLGLVVIAAAKEAQKGSQLDQVIAVAQSAASRIRIRMAFDTLEYVRRGGRIGAAQAFVGNLLNLKPILTLKDGIATPVTRERTRAKAIEHLRRFASSYKRIEAMAVEHATTLDEALALREDLGSIFPREHIYVCTIGSVMGTHLGPGALGVALLEGE
ncbi:MAG: DegV family protein [Chloroflexi bacterium]|nr:MAG: DegV family protein [Chloroflexota bacterium]